MLRSLSSHALPHRLFPSEHIRHSYSLAPLGVSRTGGLSRRPIFLGGAATENLLSEMSSFVSSATVRQASVPGPFGWSHDYVPMHPTGSEAPAEKWLSAEPAAPKKARDPVTPRRTPIKRVRAVKPPHSSPPGRSLPPSRVVPEPPQSRKRKRSLDTQLASLPKKPRQHDRSPPRAYG